MTEMLQKVARDYLCECCDYKCCNKTNFNKHLLTRRHVNNYNELHKIGEKYARQYTCDCGKIYKYRQGLHAHRKNCDGIAPSESTTKPNDSEVTTDTNIYTIVNKLISENQDLRKFILEQSSEHKKETHELITKTLECCKPSNVTHNNNTINGNVNNKFNLNVFLNEQCKDAINFADFVKNIEITYEDLENNAQLGFVNGISKIFLDNLKQLGINERPIHCTDVKRETMYIKDEDKWTKETDDAKLQKAIQTVSYRSMGKLAEWKNENPDYKDCNSEFSQKCLDIQKQTLAGSDRGVYYPKVIHALAREVVVDK
jgi:hypothetical protein